MADYKEFRLVSGKRILRRFEASCAYDFSEEQRSKLVFTWHFPFVKREHYVITCMKYADSYQRPNGTWARVSSDSKYTFGMSLSQVCAAIGVDYQTLEETTKKSVSQIG